MAIKKFGEWLGLQVVRFVIFGILIPIVLVGAVISLPGIIWGEHGE